MNRLVRPSTDPIDERSLPPPTREPGAPARILFLHTTEVGFATTAANLEHYAAHRPDIDAVHIRLVMPKWLRVACKQFPVPIGELDYRYLRHMLFWRAHLRTLVGPGRHLPTERFDVVHITTQQRALVISDLRQHRRAGAHTKFAINMDATLRNWESMRGLCRLAPTIDWLLEGRILRSADMVACATRWVADSAATDYGVDPSRLVIHKPCARVRITPDRPAHHHGPIRLLFVGGNWRDKDGPRLLRWHQQRWADRAELHIVSGSAPRDPSARNVVYHGKLPHDALVDLLPTMDLFVVPTKWDTFMIAAQEAQAAGLPVVTTRTGGVPECVADGVTGILCDRSDDDAYIRAVESLMSDPALRHRMGQAGIERARTDLNPDTWHTHLLDQLVALADSRPLHLLPAALPGPPLQSRHGVTAETPTPAPQV